MTSSSQISLLGRAHPDRFTFLPALRCQPSFSTWRGEDRLHLAGDCLQRRGDARALRGGPGHGRRRGAGRGDLPPGRGEAPGRTETVRGADGMGEEEEKREEIKSKDSMVQVWTNCIIACMSFLVRQVESIVEATQMLVSDRRPLQLMAAVGEGSSSSMVGPGDCSNTFRTDTRHGLGLLLTLLLEQVLLRFFINPQ